MYFHRCLSKAHFKRAEKQSAVHCPLPWWQGTVAYRSRRYCGRSCRGRGRWFGATCCLWGTRWGCCCCCRCCYCSCTGIVLLIWTPACRCLRGAICSWAFTQLTGRGAAGRSWKGWGRSDEDTEEAYICKCICSGGLVFIAVTWKYTYHFSV